jgi:hypothetical protein
MNKQSGDKERAERERKWRLWVDRTVDDWNASRKQMVGSRVTRVVFAWHFLSTFELIYGCLFHRAC